MAHWRCETKPRRFQHPNGLEALEIEEGSRCRLHAFSLIFKARLHGTFDAELDEPTGPAA